MGILRVPTNYLSTGEDGRPYVDPSLGATYDGRPYSGPLPPDLTDVIYGFDPSTGMGWSNDAGNTGKSVRGPNGEVVSRHPWPKEVTGLAQFAPELQFMAAAFGGSQLAAGLGNLASTGSLGLAAPDAVQPGIFETVAPEYSYVAQGAGGPAGTITSTVTPVSDGGTDAIGRIADLTRGNDLTATEAARRAGYTSTEAYLKAIDPSLLSAAGTAAAVGGAAASGPAWSGAPSGGGTISGLLTPANIVAGTSLAGAALGSNAAKTASQIQAEATDRAIAESRRASEASIDEIRRQYDTSRADLEPWRTAGTGAIRELSTLTAPGGDLRKTFTVADFWNDPVVQLGHEFGLKEGNKAITNMAASRGMKHSGETIKALTKFGADYTGTKAGESRGRFLEDQNNVYTRLSGIAGTGAGATTAGVNAGTSTAGQVAGTNANTGTTIAGLMSGLGNARGAASIAGTNAWSGGLDTIGKYFQQQQLLEALKRAA